MSELVQTKHPSRSRLDRMVRCLTAAQGPDAADKLDALLTTMAEPAAAAYLTALCNAWLGPPQRRSPRSDREQFHALPERVWELGCAVCAARFYASRFDARYCSTACRQRAYRQRHAALALLDQLSPVSESERSIPPPAPRGARVARPARN